MHVAVIGAGIVGTLTAYYLAESGMQVTLIDQNNQPGQEATAANASQLCYGILSPTGSPDLLSQLPRILLGQHARIKICRYHDPKLWLWAFELLFKNCTNKAFLKNQKTLLDLASQSQELMTEFQQQHNFNFDYKKNGRLNTYTDPKAFDTEIIRTQRIAKEFNTKLSILSSQDCLKIEPILKQRQGKKIIGGIYSGIDCTGDSEKFTKHLCHDILSHKENVVLRFNSNIQSLNISNNKICNISTATGSLKADHYILCNGTWAPKLLLPIGIKLPIYPIRGQNLTLNRPEHITLQTNIIDMEHQIVMSPLGDRLRFAQGFEFDSYNKSLSQKSLDRMLRDIHIIAPQLTIKDYSLHTGFRPYTPNSCPIVTSSEKYKNLSFNLGHGMLGWTLAHATAYRCVQNIASNI